MFAIALQASPSRGDLAGRYTAGQQQASQLQGQIQYDTGKIQGFEGTLSSLEARLRIVERSLATQEQLLEQVRVQLAGARASLHRLQVQYARDRQVLAHELLDEYETPPPAIVNVVVDAGGFDDLLNQLSDLKAIERRNTEATQLVVKARSAVAAEARRLAVVEARRQRTTAAVLVERDQIVQLRVSIVNRELSYAHARAQQTKKLNSLRKKLAHEASVLDQQAAAAQQAAFGSGSPPPGGCVNTPYVPHGGQYGFFPAPGTNYTVNEEPVIAARLDALGKALQLHLIGISGYRSPQHSVEVGGFADDPHTRGEASDTPGIEGVPESTLEQYCLTRPFPGAREADHIQEL